MDVVLVVAEDEAVCSSIQNALPETELILTAASLEEALQRLVAFQADALFVEETPSLNLCAIQQLRMASGAAPVILIPSTWELDSYAQYAEAGVAACLPRWPTVEQLQSCLSHCLQTQAAGRPAVPVAQRTKHEPEAAGDAATLEAAVQQLERRMILQALEEASYVQTQAAKRLGVTRRILKYKMDQLGITEPA